jgi:hypothetical protein
MTQEVCSCVLVLSENLDPHDAGKRTPQDGVAQGRHLRATLLVQGDGRDDNLGGRCQCVHSFIRFTTVSISSILSFISWTEISPEAAEVKQPLLFVAFTSDCIWLPIMGDTVHAKYVKGEVTRKEITGDHWGVESHAEELSVILLEWLRGLDS